VPRKPSVTSPERFEADSELDQQLRPTTFDEFVGQEKLVSNLKIFISAAKQRNEALDHVLLVGPPGLGKTTLAMIIARQMGSNLRTTTGPVLERPADLAGLLASLDKGDVLFIDEIHRLNPAVEEYLYAAMEDFKLNIIVDSGPNARSYEIGLQPFTLIGATTRAGLLSAPLLSRFGVVARLDYYPPENLQRIAERSSRILGVRLTEDGAREIALRSRGTPRIVNRLLRRCRDFAQADARLAQFNGAVTHEVVHHALAALDVDDLGLDEMDKRLLLTIIEKFHGGPVGLNTIAVAVGEDPGTVEEVYEPYLIQAGLLQRTPRGREATPNAYQHFGKIYPHGRQQSFFSDPEQGAPQADKKLPEK